MAVDWQTIKTEYITGNISYRKLCQKHGVSYTTLSERALDEGWVKARERFRAKTLSKTLDKTSEREANRLARLMDTTSRAIDVAVKAFEDEDQFNRYLIERREEYAVPLIRDNNPDGPSEDGGPVSISQRTWTEERTFRKVDTKALKDLTAVLKDLTGLMRDFYNIPTQAQAEAQRIAAERLEMDKKKADAASEAGRDVVVVLEGAGPEEWNE